MTGSDRPPPIMRCSDQSAASEKIDNPARKNCPQIPTTSAADNRRTPTPARPGRTVETELMSTSHQRDSAQPV